MEFKEQEPFQYCCFCLKQDSHLLTENSILHNILTQFIKTQVPQYFCTECFKKFEVIYELIICIKNEWTIQQIHNFEQRCCNICFISENIISFPKHALSVFQSIIGYQLKLDPKYICMQCLKKLKTISEFMSIIKQNQTPECVIPVQEHILTSSKSLSLINSLKFEDYSENIVKYEKSNILDIKIKEESLQEDEDDEFVETPTKLTIKTECNIFSYDFEANNNFIIKTEEILSQPEEKDNVIVEDSDYQKNVKLEIEDEGLQYDYKEIIPVDCTTCNRSFKTTRGYLYHLKQRFRCRNQTAYIAQSWRSFLNNHSKHFKCQVCLKYFSNVQQKIQHIKKHFGKFCVICFFCGRLFIKQNEYMQHYRLHLAKQLPIKCKMCPRKFPSKSTYLQHMTTHKLKYRCKICRTSCARKQLLKAHMKKEKVPCLYCPKVFCSKTSLTSHLRSHTGERPFECAVCSNRFSHKGNLIKHSRIHTGYRPHLCKICFKSFSRPDYLAQHYLHVHNKPYEGMRRTYHNITRKKYTKPKNENQLFYCDICNKGFPSKCSLSSHLRVHNKDKLFQCTVCDKSFSYKGLLTGHMKIHLDYRPFACTMCSKTFIKRNDLTRHTYTHTKEKNFKCEICLVRFARKDVLRVHLRNHTGQRPYECDNCCKTFLQKSNLTQHLKKCQNMFAFNMV